VSRSPSHLVRPADVLAQFDETDMQNKCYICFRRCEIQAIHKTRAFQVTSSNKLLRLQSELLSSLELAKNVLNRETLKREGSHTWEKQLSLVELKGKFPTLGAKEDSCTTRSGCQRGRKWTQCLRTYLPIYLLAASLTIDIFDWSSKLPGLRIETHGGDLGSPSHMEATIRPKERTAIILSQIEREMLRQKTETTNGMIKST
jgi:enhancer of polycomb-like protein